MGRGKIVHRPELQGTNGNLIGDRIMNVSRKLLLGILVAAVCLSAATTTARAADDDLRNRVLALNNITGNDTLKGQVLILLDDPAGARKLLAAATGMAKETKQPFNPSAILILATLASELKDTDAAEVFYKIYGEQALQLLSERGVAAAYSGLIRTLYKAKKYAETERLCREFLEIDGGETIDRLKSGVLQQMLMAMTKQGQGDKALEVIDRLLKKQPDNWLSLEMKAQVQRDMGKLEDAAKTYDEMGERIRSDKKLTKEQQEALYDEVRYALSNVYVDLKQIDKAAEQLKALLAREPNNPTYNNDLGYIWADHDMNIAESEKLVRKAIEEDRRQRRKANPDLKPEEDKDNPAYLDSLAWVLYKQKKYKEAKPLLLDVVKEEEGKHIEIYDHLGDVLMALGEKAEAIAAWKKGIEVAGNTKREKERKEAVEKKIQANK
jgi:tetratricopeptide (TPR) repeat protein